MRFSRKLLALIPPQIASQQTNRELIMTNYATLSGIYDAERGSAEELDCAGGGVRRREKRRLVLRSAGGVRQRRVPARA